MILKNAAKKTDISKYHVYQRHFGTSLFASIVSAHMFAISSTMSLHSS